MEFKSPFQISLALCRVAQPSTAGPAPVPGRPVPHHSIGPSEADLIPTSGRTRPSKKSSRGTPYPSGLQTVRDRAIPVPGAPPVAVLE